MSIDLIGMFQDAVGPQVKGKLSGMLGVDEAKASEAFNAGSSAMLGGLMKKAQGGGDGAREIYEAAQNQDDGLMDKLGDLLSGGEQADELEKSGGGILDTVLGGDSGNLISTISKFLGLDEGKGGSLLKLIAPILLSFIGRQIKAKSLDAAGLGKLLSDQSEHLGKHVPAGLVSQLGMSNLTANVSESVAAASQTAASSASEGGSLLKILVPILLVGLVLLGLWLFVLKPMMHPKVVAPVVPTSGPGSAGEPVERKFTKADFTDQPGIDMEALGETGEDLSVQFADVASDIARANDQESAEDVVVDINNLSDEIDEMNLGDLTGDAKSSASLIIGDFIETVKGLLSKMDNEEVKKVIEPAFEKLVEKLSSFSS